MDNDEKIKEAMLAGGDGIVFGSQTQHIGKRSGAGPWCSACNVSFLVVPLTSNVDNDSKFHDKCPKCDSLIKNAIGVCMFTFGKYGPINKRIMQENKEKICARDEYGCLYNGEEMLEIIDNCKIFFIEMNHFN